MAMPLCVFVRCPLWNGGVAQLGERLLCKQEVIGSIPFTSTNLVSVGMRNRPVHELGKKCHSRLVPPGARRGFVD